MADADASSGGWRTVPERVAAAETALHIAAPSTGTIEIAFLAITSEDDGTNFLMILKDGASGTAFASLQASDGSLVLNPGKDTPIELTKGNGLERVTSNTAGAFNIVTVYRVEG